MPPVLTRASIERAGDQRVRLAAAAAALEQHEKKDVDGGLTSIASAAGELAVLEAGAARAKQGLRGPKTLTTHARSNVSASSDSPQNASTAAMRAGGPAVGQRPAHGMNPSRAGSAWYLWHGRSKIMM